MSKFIVPPEIFLPALVAWLVFSSASTVFDENEKKDLNIMQEQKVSLPSPDLKGEISTEKALSQRRSVRSYKDEPLEIKWIGQLLWAAQGITLESKGFRTAPSAGATYPLEIYVAAGRVNGLQPGLYKYNPDGHSLVKVSDGDIRSQLASAALGQQHVSEAPAVFIVAADYSRTAGRYGERAPRYVHMEAGHASQNICLQAITYELGTVIVGAFNDDQMKSVLGLPANEDPLNLIPLGKPD